MSSESLKFLGSTLGTLLLWCALSASVWQPAVWLVPFICAWFLYSLMPETRHKPLKAALINALCAFLLVRSDFTSLLLGRDAVTAGLTNGFLDAHTLSLTLAALAAGLLWSLWGEKPLFKERRFALGVLGATALLLALQSLCLNPGFSAAMQIDSGRRPVGNDGSLYRQMYYRVCEGQSVYSAIAENCLLSGNVGIAPPFAFGYRLPSCFMLWKYCTWGWGMGVTYLFLIFSALAMYSVWRAGEAIIGSLPAYAAAAAIGPLFFYGVSSWLMLMTEYWAMFFVIFSLPFIVRRHSLGASLCLIMAAITREFMLLPALLLPAAAYAEKWEKKGWTCLPLAIGLTFLAVHLFTVFSCLPELLPCGLFDPDSGSGGWQFLLTMLQYAEPFYACWAIVGPVLFVLSLLSLKYLPKGLSLVLGGFLLGFAVFAFLGGKSSSFYWGIIPTACILILSSWAPFCISERE
ncbi:hypothetical protein IJT93_11590 [bacterium]|nr:hypothetical protein [bacterium]